MKTFKFIIEKTGTGFSAYSEDFEKIPVTTTGETAEELRMNLLEALNTWLEYKSLPLARREQIKEPQ